MSWREEFSDSMGWILITVAVGIVLGCLLATAENVKDIKHTLDRIEKQQKPKVVSCTHGESSVIVTVGKDGKLHQSRVAVTGCQP